MTGEIECWGLNNYGQATAPSGQFSDVSVGADLACGVRTDGAIQCWGRNDFGQANPPSDVKFQIVAAASTFACGIDLERHVHCWGHMPNDMAPPDRFTRLVARDWMACGTTESGRVLCVGGNPTTAHSPGGIRFTEVTISDEDVCGVDDLGIITCWGYQLRFTDERREDNMLITSPPMGPRVRSIAAGPAMLCWLDVNDALVCFGGSWAGLVPPTGRFGQ